MAGFPVDGRSKLTSSSTANFHDVDSVGNGVRASLCEHGAFKRGRAQKAKPQLLEPIMKVEVVTPRTTWATSSAI